MGIINTSVDGVLMTNLKRIDVAGGDIFHAMKASSQGYCGFGEAYFTTITPGSIKSWKQHFSMTLNLVVISGKVKFVLFDDRDGSCTKSMYQTVLLGPSTEYGRLTVPPLVWMAFQCVGQELGIILNIANIEHLPSEAARKDIYEIPYNWSAE